MITGHITADAEATLQVVVQKPDDEKKQIRVEAVIDTGFNSALTLPPEQIEALGLPEFGDDQVQLGDGSFIVVRLFEAVVRVGEQPRRLLVEEAPTTPLIGTELLWDCRVCIDFEVGGRVEVEPLP